jgi:hypothetical protein
VIHALFCLQTFSPFQKSGKSSQMALQLLLMSCSNPPDKAKESQFSDLQFQPMQETDRAPPHKCGRWICDEFHRWVSVFAVGGGRWRNDSGCVRTEKRDSFARLTPDQEQQIELKKLPRGHTKDVAVSDEDILYVPTSGSKRALDASALVAVAAGTAIYRAPF